jgi:hypothetical protein
MATNSNAKLAVLIDADNETAQVIKELLEEVSRYGTATIKRAYGNWTTPQLGGWKEVLHTMAIQPVQQFNYTTGKNATDSALIIDAMDVLHTGRVDGFCLVSSDSDFTRLATRIREAGLVVYGFGKRSTPEAFQAACDKFIYTEILRAKPEESKAEAAPAEASTKPAVDVAELPKLQPMILTALDAVARDDGWAPLGPVGSLMNKNNPSFDPRNYGFSQLSKLMRKQEYLDLKEVPMGDGSSGVHLHVRRKAVAPKG